jgi:hypothetical protein
MRRINSRLVVVGMIVGASATLGLPGSSMATASPVETSMIRVAHFSPDTPGVDVYLTAFSGGTTSLWVPNAEYGGVSPYKRVAAGLYVVAMRPHGAATSTPAAVSWNLQVKPGQAYTAAAIGSNKALKTIVLHDDLALPAQGMGRVRLVQAASRAPTADVTALNGPVVASNAPFASTTAYTSVPAGTWTLRATDPSSPTVSTSASLAVRAGTVSSILLLDAKGGGITLRSVLDAASVGSVPIGAVPAGAGGTAGNRHFDSSLAAAAGAAVLVMGSVAVFCRRRSPV